MPPAAAITGWAGLRWQGATWFDGRPPHGRGELPVTIASCQDDIRNQRGFVLCQERLNPRDIIDVDGLRVTTAARSVCFEMRYARDVRDAVAILDMAAFYDLVSIAEESAYALAHPGWTGIPQARDALALADENSWSWRETDLRMIWVLDAGLSPPLCNQPIFDRHGRHIGTPDLLDPESGAIGEYDGVLHLEGSRRSRDSHREDEFRNHGLEPFHVVGHDMADRWLVAERIHAARRRAKWEAESQRSWTIEPPPWWQESNTVEQRRALTGRVRDAVLALRRRSA
jgi:hypothetical protein